MVTLTFDAIVIGTSHTGPSLAARLASEGKQVAIIDTPLPEGTRASDNAAATKALVAIARTAHQARCADNCDIDINSDSKVDMQQVQARVKEVSAAATKSSDERLHNLDGVTVIRRHARFEANDTIRCGEQLVQAEQICINVGGRPVVPTTFADIGAMTSIDMPELTQLPEHLIVVGGSCSGIEFAQIFRRLGSNVTIIEREARILSQQDKSLSQSVHELLAAEGIRIMTGAECLSGERSGDQVAIQLASKDHPKYIKGSHLLLAFGRQPNTADLGLQNTDMAVNKHGFIRVDDSLQTTAEGVWAVGECSGSGSSPNTFRDHHALKSSPLLADSDSNQSYLHLSYDILIDPPLGRVGMNQQAARDSGRNILIGHQPIENINCAAGRGENHGFIEVLVDTDSEEILGATVHGIAGIEAAHSLLDMMHAGTSYRVFAKHASLHPTISERLPKILQSLQPLV